MKKITVILVVLILLAVPTLVLASANQDILNYINRTFTIGGEAWTLPASDRVQIERFLSQNTLTSEQVDSILGYAREVEAILQEAGTTNISELTDAQRRAIADRLVAAGNVLGLRVVIDWANGSIVVTDSNGRTVFVSGRAFKATGSDIMMSVGITAVAIVTIAGTAYVITKKEFNI